ncbi:MAG: hypothetical protein ABGW87_03315 [Sphingomonadaceae bacterium]
MKQRHKHGLAKRNGIGLAKLAAVLAYATPLLAQGNQPAESPAANQAARDAAAASEAAASEFTSASPKAEAMTSSASGRLLDPTRLSDSAIRKRAVALEPLESYASTTPQFNEWARDLHEGLKKAPLATVSKTLASRYGLSPDAMHALSRDWLVARIGDYDFANDSALANARHAFVVSLATHVAAAGSTPFALEIAAHAIGVAGDCNDLGYVALLASAPDKALANWALARGSSCPASMLGALPDPTLRTSSLLMLLSANELQGIDAITPEAWLLRESALDRVSAENRIAVRRWLQRDLIANLLDAGMTDDALQHFADLDAETRAAVLAPTMPSFDARIDDAGFTLRELGPSLRTALAAAMLSAGRNAEASALIRGDPDLAAKRVLVDCIYAAQSQTSDEQPNCKVDKQDADNAISSAVDTLLVKQALDAPEADPYRLVEVGFSFRDYSRTPGSIIRIRCQVLSDVQYRALCQDWRHDMANHLALPEERKAFGNDPEAMNKAIAAAELPGWTALAAHYEDVRKATRSAFTDAPSEEAQKAWADRPPVDPDPTPFTEHLLPAALHTPADKSGAAPVWPHGWRPLPQGFMPVRTGVSNNRAVAVSLSGRFDPSGEVAEGGYWVHVSEDGGKTWQAPIYTGLADHFPYVVATHSKLPLIDGDTLNIEVSIALLDTRSIMYPPVALRTRRQVRDLFLRIPLAALRADTNRDGLTDIAAHHLLLDRASGLAPFVVGSDHAHCAAQSDPVQALRAKMLIRLIGGRQDRALHETIDRPVDTSLAFGWAMMPAATTWPLFIKGNSTDFACMTLPVPAFVYDAAGEAALQRETPDFRLLEAPPLIMNRERTRGFMRWSLGWTGGTTMAILSSDGWHTIDLQSWIT